MGRLEMGCRMELGQWFTRATREVFQGQCEWARPLLLDWAREGEARIGARGVGHGVKVGGD